VSLIVVSLVLGNTGSNHIKEHIDFIGWSLGLKMSLDSRKDNVSEGISINLSQGCVGICELRVDVGSCKSKNQCEDG